MSEKSKDSGLPNPTEPRPGAEITMRTKADGGVNISFSDGSNDLDVSRREFMRISGVAAASAALAGAACRNPVEHIVPYVDRPEEIRIGQSNYYASVCSGCSAQCGVLVETRAGRPIKIEGNPDHPVSRGATCARGQASYRRLYDPDRQRAPLKVSKDDRHEELTWEAVDRAVNDALGKVRAGGGVRILTSTMTGSAQQALISEITDALPNAKHYTYDPLTSHALSAASKVAYGDAHIPRYRFDKADLIVSMGSDFLGTWLSPVEFTKQFSSRRNLDGNMSRLVAFEGYLSVTGANADDRYRVRYTDLPYVAMALAQQIAKSGPAANSAVASRLAGFAPAAVAERTGVPAEVLTEIAAELAQKRGRSLVVAGDMGSSTENGIALESAVNLLNQLLGNVGQTVYHNLPSRQAAGGFTDLQALVADIEAGQVDVLIIDGTNPVYSAPPELNIAEAIARVPTVVCTHDRVNETAHFADYLATGNHALESWGDSHPFQGIYAIRQPTIRPLYFTRAFEESLIVWFGQSLVPTLKPYLGKPEAPAGNRPGNAPTYDPGAWYRYLRDHWQAEIYPLANAYAGFDAFWEAALRQGVFIDETQSANAAARMNMNAVLGALPDALPKAKKATTGLADKELHLFATVPLGDGDMANDGHLQELPDPISKNTWGSYVLLSPRTFKEAGLANGDVLTLTVEVAGRKVERPVPAIMQPGMHDDVIAVPLGYGRTRCGVVGSDLGINGFELSHTADSLQVLSGIKATLSPTGENIPPAIPQGSQVIDLGLRPIIATGTLAEYKEDPAAGMPHRAPLYDMWPAHDYEPLKWGMSIDMTKCTGCNACVVACQEENNVPVVGRQGVVEGREMHWLRIDRYYKLPEEDEEFREKRSSVLDDPMYARDTYVELAEYMDNPRVFMQPMLCQHCTQAPCETVCPVLATTHSTDGLNQMAYNRCVGTRYCANNCPYKVRRFNWYNYSEDRSDGFLARIFPEMGEHARLNIEEPLPMAFNPEVVVRSRGVMEKCTFCVHRIRKAQWQITKEGRSEVRDGDVVTACQQVCPADAIEFGNLLDEGAAVAVDHKSPRALSVLGEIGTEPAIAYLSSIWNTETVDN
jgi:molybdopterin-containing oxidoreductase family iron-sulfur binding subunit